MEGMEAAEWISIRHLPKQMPGRASMKHCFPLSVFLLSAKEHVLGIFFDVAGIDHVVLCLYCAEILSDKRFPDNPVRRRCNRKVAAGGKPGGLVVREALQDFPAVTADIVDYAIVDGLFAGREY